MPGTKALFKILGFGFLREFPVLKKQMCVCVCVMQKTPDSNSEA